MAQKRCNICGIPEEEWTSGICTSCGHSKCEVRQEDIIERRAYEYAEKKGLLDTFAAFNKRIIREKLSEKKFHRKTPAYVQEAASCDGLSFTSLKDFPTEKVFRVCMNGKSKDFQVGDLVWRSELKPGIPDTMNFLQEAAALDEEFCIEALQGAMFEETMIPVPKSS